MNPARMLAGLHEPIKVHFEVFEVTTSATYTASRNMKVGCTWDTSREGCLRKKVIIIEKK